MSNKKPIVIYHNPCLDGFTAAWAVWLLFPDWEFRPGVHGQPPPDCTGRDVFLLDFSYKKDVIQQLVKVANRVTIIDHHATAKEDIQCFLEDGTIDGVFDMNHSGAYLSWQWFHSTEPPYFVRLVEDRDLWRFALPETKDANAFFFSFDYDFSTWSDFCRFCDEPISLKNLISGGMAIERKFQKDLAEILPRARHTLCIAGNDVPAVNLPYTMASEAGNILSEGEPFAAVYFREGDVYKFSLRSKETGLDVSQIAKQYGGGGHPRSSGFQVRSLEEL